MMLLSLAIFSFCVWAVFSRHIHEGLTAKHCFAFAAITAMLHFKDPANVDTLVAAAGLTALGGLFWALKFLMHLDREKRKRPNGI